MIAFLKSYIVVVSYTKNIIQSLLQLFDGQLHKIRLQKLLFLFTNFQAKAEYDIIPYKFGCNFYSSNADMTAMITKGFLQEDKKILKRKTKPTIWNK